MRWADAIDPQLTFLSVITLLEIEIGIERIARRDASQGLLLRSWMDDRLIPAFASRILAIDLAVARACARLHVPDPASERDAFIAATATVHNLAVVTRNVRDFAAFDLRLIDPWQVR